MLYVTIYHNIYQIIYYDILNYMIYVIFYNILYYTSDQKPAPTVKILSILWMLFMLSIIIVHNSVNRGVKCKVKYDKI